MKEKQASEMIRLEDIQEIHLPLVNITEHIVRIFPFEMASRVLIPEDSRFIDPLTSEPAPFLEFPPVSEFEHAIAVPVGYEVEGAIVDDRTGMRVPVVRARFAIRPSKWDSENLLSEGVLFIASTVVMLHAWLRWGDRSPFVAPLVGRYAVRDPRGNVIGTVALAKGIIVPK